MEELRNNIQIILPLIIINLILIAVALYDLYKKDVKMIRFENKLTWVLIIMFFQMIGPVGYLVLGKKSN